MGKKKHKINKITEQQYLQYIAGLKDDTPPIVNTDGDILIPDAFKDDENKNNE